MSGFVKLFTQAGDDVEVLPEWKGTPWWLVYVAHNFVGRLCEVSDTGQNAPGGYVYHYGVIVGLSGTALSDKAYPTMAAAARALLVANTRLAIPVPPEAEAAYVEAHLTGVRLGRYQKTIADPLWEAVREWHQQDNSHRIWAGGGAAKMQKKFSLSRTRADLLYQFLFVSHAAADWAQGRACASAEWTGYQF